MIVDPQRGREARFKAFLNVPLYKTVYKGEGGIDVRAATAHRSPRPE
jgi:hypothetical protein